MTPVITENTPEPRPRTNQSNGEHLPQKLYANTSTHNLQASSKLFFACAACQTPLFNSKDFVPHTAQQI